MNTLRIQAIDHLQPIIILLSNILDTDYNLFINAFMIPGYNNMTIRTVSSRGTSGKKSLSANSAHISKT